MQGVDRGHAGWKSVCDEISWRSAFRGLRREGILSVSIAQGLAKRGFFWVFLFFSEVFEVKMIDFQRPLHQ